MVINGLKSPSNQIIFLYGYMYYLHVYIYLKFIIYYIHGNVESMINRSEEAQPNRDRSDWRNKIQIADPNMVKTRV